MYDLVWNVSLSDIFVAYELSLFRFVGRARRERKSWEKNSRVKSWDFRRPFFPRGFRSRHARPTKRKRDNSYSNMFVDTKTYFSAHAFRANIGFVLRRTDDLHLFKISSLIRSCWSAPLLFLGLGALLLLYTYWFIWRIMRNLVNGAWTPKTKTTTRGARGFPKQKREVITSLTWAHEPPILRSAPKYLPHPTLLQQA